MKKYQQEIEELRKLLVQGNSSGDEDEDAEESDNNEVVLINDNSG